jgi:hypothetical protein
MPKVSELKTAGQFATEELADPEIRCEYERTALTHDPPDDQARHLSAAPGRSARA